MGKFNRSKSSIINLRIFHNWVKNELYKTTASSLRQNVDGNNLSILELAVGRAGDLYKWFGIGATDVVGVDIDEKSIYGKDGAYHRYRRVRNQNPKQENDTLRCTFYVMDLSKPESFIKLKHMLKEKKFDIVSCQFAFHYFFESEAAINNILRVVKYFCAPHGYFILTTMNGNKLKDAFNGNDKIESESFSIIKKYDNSSLYGQKYIVSLGDKGEDHYFTQNASTEYLVDLNELNKKMGEFGLKQTRLKGFSEWYEEYKTIRDHKKLGKSEQDFSFFNFSAIYKIN